VGNFNVELDKEVPDPDGRPKMRSARSHERAA
jgi:hypothetical protein